MSKRAFDVGAEILLKLTVPGFGTEADAGELAWNRRRTLPPGRYVVRDCGRSEGGPHDETHSHGFYYEVEGPERGWVRQNYLLAAQHEDWPWDLTFCLEPLKWDEAWSIYARRNDAARPRAGSSKPVREASAGSGSENGAGSVSCAVDEFGVPVADSGRFLPDFDSIFELEDE